MKTRPLLLLPLGIIACACACGGGEMLKAQEPSPSSQEAQTAQPVQPVQAQKKPAAGQPQNAPILVAGTEFMILDPVPVKPKEGGGKNRLPLSLVVLAWVLAMVLWQAYFNRKARQRGG